MLIQYIVQEINRIKCSYRINSDVKIYCTVMYADLLDLKQESCNGFNITSNMRRKCGRKSRVNTKCRILTNSYSGMIRDSNTSEDKMQVFFVYKSESSPNPAMAGIWLRVASKLNGTERPTPYANQALKWHRLTQYWLTLMIC